MSKLLYIESSPRKNRSSSIAVALHFLAAYRKGHPDDTIETLDLWKTTLPPFSQAIIDAKYAILHGQPHSPEQALAWEAVVQLASQFKAADKHVLSVPMWNFSIPYILKHYIDLIVQPGLTFSFTPAEGYKGLVTGKPALGIFARGGAYEAGTPAEGYDQQIRYIRQVLGFVGFTDIKQIVIEPTLASPEARNKAVAAGKKAADELAEKF